MEAETYTGIYATHKYWSKKPSNIIRELIRKNSSAGDIVLDPFCGSGVSVVEAAALNRRAVGIDINPAGIMIAGNLIRTIDVAKARAEFESIKEDVRNEMLDLYRVEREGKTHVASHYIWDGGIPVEVWYKRDGKTAKEAASASDIEFSLSLKYSDIKTFVPEDRLFSNARINVKTPVPVYELFTPRNLQALSFLHRRINLIRDAGLLSFFKFCFTSILGQTSRMVFAVSRRGKYGGNRDSVGDYEVGSWVIGYWKPKKHFEINVWNTFERRVMKTLRAKADQMAATGGAVERESFHDLAKGDFGGFLLVNGASQLALKKFPDNSIDYVITDPPHGDREPYLELSMMWNSWLGNNPDYRNEIVISNSKDRNKGTSQYLADIGQVFAEIGRVLKPGGKLTLFFNALDEEIWASVINGATTAGLEFLDMESMKYSAGSVIQDTRKMGLKSDMILTFSKTSSVICRNEVEIVKEAAFVDSAIKSAMKELGVVSGDRFKIFSIVNSRLISNGQFVPPSYFFGRLELQNVLEKGQED